MDQAAGGVSPSFVGRSVKVLVLDGILNIHLDGDLIASHKIRDTRHKRYVLPEHEAEFRQHSSSRHALQEQFPRLGEVAQTFMDSLVKAHGGAAGCHISEILKLADQVGVPRALEVLRHAARYGAFSHTSVARIVQGKRPPRQRASTLPSEPVPQDVTEYLKAADHSQRPIEHLHCSRTRVALKGIHSVRLPISPLRTQEHLCNTICNT